MLIHDITPKALGYGKGAFSTVKVEGVELAVATLELTAFEIMYLIPKRQFFDEAMQIIESLTALRPHVV
ncbi:type IV toxin-antitoxin system AbiEi family antitoxin domain-containing protein [Candidatus Thiodiazotropha sp. LNASS1]|uniref:type IV toxin-antitoxin system AbiEi family antitoxin domain-containing protein n=1 Tax=Candidatus Thiodiazotropha sp. LNASS1 TaxID=3096260 RepID=UPI0034DE0D7D